MDNLNKNNSFDEIDNSLFNYYKSEKFNYIPDVVTNGIETVMYTNKVKIFNLYDFIRQIIITILSILTLTGGVVFAKDIENFFNNLFNNMNGVTTAINNGYITDTEMEYINSNDVNIRVDEVLMDDYNLCLNLNVDLSKINNIDLNNISSIYFKDLVLLDENNEVIFSSNNNYIDTYCLKNNINNLKNDYNSSVSYYINNIDLENKSCTLTYNFSRCNNTFPKSKKLLFGSSGIEIEKQSSDQVNVVTINCEHNLTIDIPEKFYNRQALVYTVKSSNDENFILNDATVYETGTKISFDLKIDNDIINEEKLQQSHNLLTSGNYVSNELSSQLKTFFNPFSDIYLVDSNNTKYSMTRNHSEDNVLNSNIKGHLIFTCTFDLTKFDATDEIQLHFIYDSKEINVILQK